MLIYCRHCGKRFDPSNGYWHTPEKGFYCSCQCMESDMARDTEIWQTCAKPDCDNSIEGVHYWRDGKWFCYPECPLNNKEAKGCVYLEYSSGKCRAPERDGEKCILPYEDKIYEDAWDYCERREAPVDRGWKLAEEHWRYVKGVLEVAGRSGEQLEEIEYHYLTAFEHGFKHGQEGK